MAHPTNRKWVITLVVNGISRVSPLITGVITHLLSGMNHQVVFDGCGFSELLHPGRLQTKCSLRKYAKNMPGHSFLRFNSHQEIVDLAQLKHIDF